MARTFLLKAEIRTVYNIGINIFSKTFQDAALCPYIGQRVNVRYNDDDNSVIYVYSPDGEFVTEIHEQEALNPLAPMTDRVLEAHVRDQQRQITAAREAGAALQGKAERAEEILPAMAGDPPVVALPSDKQFKSMPKKSKKKQTVNVNEYLEKQAELALDEIRKNMA